VRVELSLRVSDGRVRAAAFRAYGCPHVIAACSWLAERVVGLNRDELAAWDWREVQQTLDVPPQKFGRLLTIQDAARDAARNWPV
jgi:NifU-like protein involved in Fe-S cluster formation